MQAGVDRRRQRHHRRGHRASSTSRSAAGRSASSTARGRSRSSARCSSRASSRVPRACRFPSRRRCASSRRSRSACGTTCRHARTPYKAAEVAEAIVACPSLEIVDTRFDTSHRTIRQMLDDRKTRFEAFADHNTTGAYIVGDGPARLAGFRLRADAHGDAHAAKRVIVETVGGHAFVDPFLPCVVLANEMRHRGGMRAGQIMVTGSFCGFFEAQPDEPVTAEFVGFGTAEATFASEIGEGDDRCVRFGLSLCRASRCRVERRARPALSVQADQDAGARSARARRPTPSFATRGPRGEDARHDVRRRQPRRRQRHARRARDGQVGPRRLHDHDLVEFRARGERVPVQGPRLRPGQGLRADHRPDQESARAGHPLEPPGAEPEGVHRSTPRPIRASSTSARATRARSPTPRC